MRVIELIKSRTVRLFAGYVAIGGLVFCIDVGLFWLIITLGVQELVANTLAFGIASLAHFLLNRQFNFRNFDRSVAAQARTYGVVVVLAYAVTMLILVVGHATGVSPIAAKLAGNAANLPLGFLAHRYLTFDQGIFAAGKRALARAQRAPLKRP